MDELEAQYRREYGKPYENWLADDSGKDRPPELDTF
jgi:hypothetical protein